MCIIKSISIFEIVIATMFTSILKKSGLSIRFFAAGTGAASFAAILIMIFIGKYTSSKDIVDGPVLTVGTLWQQLPY